MKRALVLMLPLLASACAPVRQAVLNSPRPALSAPFATGQTWEVEGQALMIMAKTRLELVELRQAMPGTFSNVNASALQVARLGKATTEIPLQNALDYSLVSKSAAFLWDDKGTSYRCQVSEPAADAQALQGKLYINDELMGTCTAKLVP